MCSPSKILRWAAGQSTGLAVGTPIILVNSVQHWGPCCPVDTGMSLSCLAVLQTSFVSVRVSQLLVGVSEAQLWWLFNRSESSEIRAFEP